MITALSAIFVFLMVILVHEFGHFAVAKLVGIKVNEFSIGMGPKLLQKQKGETRYTLRLLPIGGYVSMEGEDEESNDPRGFNKVSPISRIAVIVAGAIMNFVLAIIILGIVSYRQGIPTNIISEILPDTPAMESQLEVGDKIISINGEATNSWTKVADTISKSNPNNTMIVEVERGGEVKAIDILPAKSEDGRTIIGIVPKGEKSILSGIKGGFTETFTFTKAMVEFLKMLFKGQVGINHLSGPVGVISGVGEAAKLGIDSLLYMLGFISINLGFFNLLPIPALDGSRVLFLILELVRGKPIDSNKEGFIHLVGFVLLISLMLFVTYKDIMRFNFF